MTYIGDPTDYSEFAERITTAVMEFINKLQKSQLQHTSTQAVGEIVTHYAKVIIDKEFADTKFKLMDGAVKLIKEIEGRDFLKL